jgi:DNA-binding NarL/FixJ family response regulator
MTPVIKFPAEPLRLLICGRSPGVNASLREWLSDLDGIAVVGALSDVKEAIPISRRLRAQVVLLDFELDNNGFFYGMAMFKEVNPAMVIIVLAQCPTPAIRRHCRSLGAAFVIAKASGLDLLAGVLQKLAGRIRLE